MAANTTVRPQTVESKYQFGRLGHDWVAASSAQSGKDYYAVHFLAEGTFSVFTCDNSTGTATSVTIPAGTTIYGHITAYTASVATIAYNDLQFS